MTRMSFPPKFSRRRGHAVGLPALVVLAVGLAGCTGPTTVSQRCGNLIGDVVSGEQVLRQIIACTGLTPHDTYRIDLEQAVLKQDYGRWSIDSVKDRLDTWKAGATPAQQWQFLLTNPDSTASLPTLAADDIRQVLVTVWDQGASFPAQYWFDVEDARLAWSDDRPVLGDPGATGGPLTQELTTSLTGVLNTYLPRWDRRYPTGEVPRDTPKSPYGSWSVALVVGDYTLFRYASQGPYDNTPPDFGAFLDAIRGLVT
ncbi:MAG: hypothetical protein FWC46_04025 [Actinomycetia bacterium]|nr:hypothetical protein [Actinomycetes bacterium]